MKDQGSIVEALVLAASLDNADRRDRGHCLRSEKVFPISPFLFETLGGYLLGLQTHVRPKPSDPSPKNIII
jgi:hypothetical protein